VDAGQFSTVTTVARTSFITQSHDGVDCTAFRFVSSAIDTVVIIHGGCRLLLADWLQAYGEWRESGEPN
jgi:hypothetical protein